MAKKKGKVDNHYKMAKITGLHMNSRDKALFLHVPRSFRCFSPTDKENLFIKKILPEDVISILALKCKTIEHQILALRDTIRLSSYEFKRRHAFSRKILQCLSVHHNIIYQGFMFGSSVNGLGFRDSDVDLRLRPLRQVGYNTFEPVAIDDDMVDRVLRNIAQQTTRCCPALGEYVPSSRCPVAKLVFFTEKGPPQSWRTEVDKLQEGLKYDITLSTSSHLGIFNSMFLRFLCNLQPKFHLLVTVVRYWSTSNELIVAGYLSSYALVNMVIYFCQSIQPPLLPTVDKMRESYLKYNSRPQDTQIGLSKRAILQLEWQCMINLDKTKYKKSKNSELISVLLMKFFEFYLNFPYSSQIITIRPGRSITHEEFKRSPLFHPRFPIKDFLNIQDPFDLKHNLTCGMTGAHFKKFITVMKLSYEKLFDELTNRFYRPELDDTNIAKLKNIKTKKHIGKEDPRSWGLIPLFLKPTQQELDSY